MCENIARKPQIIASVTPDYKSRIKRTRQLLDAIAKIQTDNKLVVPLDPIATAKKLSILDRLGVTACEVDRKGKPATDVLKSASGSVYMAPSSECVTTSA